MRRGHETRSYPKPAACLCRSPAWPAAQVPGGAAYRPLPGLPWATGGDAGLTHRGAYQPDSLPSAAGTCGADRFGLAAGGATTRHTPTPDVVWFRGIVVGGRPG